MGKTCRTDAKLIAESDVDIKWKAEFKCTTFWHQNAMSSFHDISDVIYMTSH